MWIISQNTICLDFDFLFCQHLAQFVDFFGGDFEHFDHLVEVKTGGHQVFDVFEELLSHAFGTTFLPLALFFVADGLGNGIGITGKFQARTFLKKKKLPFCFFQKKSLHLHRI